MSKNSIHKEVKSEVQADKHKEVANTHRTTYTHMPHTDKDTRTRSGKEWKDRDSRSILSKLAGEQKPLVGEQTLRRGEPRG
jgi:hypothetical protein